MTTAAPEREHDRAPIELPHRVRLEILGVVLLGIFLAALDQTIVGTALPVDRHRPQGQRRLHLGLHRLPADRHGQRPDLRKAVRPLRPAPDLHDRRRASSCIGSVLCALSPGDVAVHRLPRDPGPRRRRALPGLAGDHRRHLRAVGAGQVPGLLRRRLRRSARSSVRRSAA